MNKKSHICIGLYHKYGRKPFLEFVEELKNLDESQKFKRYKEIHKLKNQTHLNKYLAYYTNFEFIKSIIILTLSIF